MRPEFVLCSFAVYAMYTSSSAHSLHPFPPALLLLQVHTQIIHIAKGLLRLLDAGDVDCPRSVLVETSRQSMDVSLHAWRSLESTHDSVSASASSVPAINVRGLAGEGAALALEALQWSLGSSGPVGARPRRRCNTSKWARLNRTPASCQLLRYSRTCGGHSSCICWCRAKGARCRVVATEEEGGRGADMDADMDADWDANGYFFGVQSDEPRAVAFLKLRRPPPWTVNTARRAPSLEARAGTRLARARWGCNPPG